MSRWLLFIQKSSISQELDDWIVVCQGNTLVYNLSFLCATFYFQAILSDTLISPNQAKQVCEKDGSILTSFENLDERTKLATVLRDFLSAKKLDRGGMIVDGHRLKNCETDDRTVLNAEPCRNSSTGFTTDEKHTDNTFMWKSWADTEPGQSIFEKLVAFRMPIVNI